MHLHGQFTGGHKDEHRNAPILEHPLCVLDTLQDREEVAGCFSTSSLGYDQEVLSREQERYGLLLNRVGLLETHTGQSLK